MAETYSSMLSVTSSDVVLSPWITSFNMQRGKEFSYHWCRQYALEDVICYTLISLRSSQLFDNFFWQSGLITSLHKLKKN
jgi:hypothetical protein